MKKDGGPAFPHDGQVNYTGGLSLRDYFAAAALEGLLCACCAGRPDDAASNAYKYADAMLKAREGKE